MVRRPGEGEDEEGAAPGGRAAERRREHLAQRYGAGQLPQEDEPPQEPDEEPGAPPQDPGEPRPEEETEDPG